METLDGRLFAFGASIECITKSLEEETSSNDSLLTKVDSANVVLDSEWIKSVCNHKDAMSNEDRIKISLFCRQLEDIVVGLWNAIVSRNNSPDFDEITCIQLRQLCYNLISCRLFKAVKQGNKADPSNSAYYNRKVMIGIKTGKGLLDVRKFEKARNILQETFQDITELFSSILKSSKLSPEDTEISNLRKNKVSLLCFLLETVFRMNDDSGVKEVLESLKNFSEEETPEGVVKLSHRERKCIVHVSYNLGLEASKDQKLHSLAEILLQFSYEFQKENEQVKTQTAQTLRLLAHVYWHQQVEKALEAAKLSNSYHKHPAGFHLVLRIMCDIKSKEIDDEMKSVLVEFLEHEKLDLDQALSACKYLNSREKFDLSEFGMEKILSRFENSKQIGRAHVQMLENKIDRLKLEERSSFATQFLSDKKTTQAIQESSEDQLHRLLWKQAQLSHQEDKVETSIFWYDRSLDIYMRGRSLEDVRENSLIRDNVAKLYRNKASCFIELSRLQEADECVKIAIQLNEDDLYTNFTKLKVAIAQDKQAEAVSSVEKIISKCEDPELQDECHIDDGNLGTKYGLVCLAAQLAFERNQRDVAMVALKHLSDAPDVNKVAKLTAHRCLVRSYLTMAEESDEKCQDSKLLSEKSPKQQLLCKAVEGLKDAFDILKEVRKEKLGENACSVGELIRERKSQRLSDVAFRDEIMWFMKVAWNIALDFGGDHLMVKDLYHMCKNMMKLLVEKDESILLRMQTCLMLSASNSLALARNDIENQEDHFRDVIDDVSECDDVTSQLNDITGGKACGNDAGRSPILLQLYRLEATAKLLGSSKPTEKIDSELMKIFDKLVSMPSTDAKNFETVAVLLMERPARHPELAKRALKQAIFKLNKLICDTTDHQKKVQLVTKRSTNYRMLIDVTILHASCLQPTNHNEAWVFSNEFYCFLQQDSVKHPETDTLWLSVKCWNVGVKFYTSNEIVWAEKWCSLAMRLLPFAIKYKAGYELRMNATYNDILAKKDSISI